MKTTRLIAGALVACCLIGMLVLPASAAPDAKGTNIKAGKIDPGLQEDLIKTHIKNRLETFDLHVQHAKDIIDVLETHQIDTSRPQAILDQFVAMRPELERALTSHDREAVKTVNAKLAELTKQFFQAVRDAIRASAATDTARAYSAGLPATGTLAI